MKKGLIIGINYIGSKYELKGCIPDAFLIQDLLQKKGYKDLTVLTDLTEIKPTKENIISSIEKIISEVKEGDELFFSFSGHGSFIKDKNGDEIDGKDELFVTLDMKGIIDDEFVKIFQKIPKNIKTIVFMDCCHSGTLLDLPYSLYKSKFKTIQNNKNKFNAPILLISGCRDNQYSLETKINGKPQGYLTFTFCSIMKNTNQISLDYLLLKIHRFLYKKRNRKQKPQLSHSFPVNWKKYRLTL